jgi:hypothetical protein
MRLPLAFALVLMASPALAGPAADAVRFFYANVGAEHDEANLDRFADPARAVLETNLQAEERCFDFGIAIDGQDYDEAELARTLRIEEEIFDADATVTAYFTLFAGQADSERIMIWTLKQVAGEWKVADIMSDGANWVLSDLDCVAG